MYSLEQKKRGLCPYDDKRYLLAHLPDGSPNPYTHAYGHKDLAAEEHFEADMPDAPGSDLIIERRERRFLQNHVRVAKKLATLPAPHGDLEVGSEDEEIPGDVALSTGDWDKAARAAAARPGVRGRVEDVLQRLIVAGRTVSTPPPPPLSQQPDTACQCPDASQRAGPSGTYHPDPKAKRAQVYSSVDDDDEEDEDGDDEEEDDEPVRRRRRKGGRNPFVLYEAAELAEEEDGSMDWECDDAYADPFYF